MQFIDKQNVDNERVGNSIVNEFMLEQWDDDSQRYINLKYQHFGEYKERMVALLRLEQSGLCCYCMRKLSDQNTTIEHVIPNKFKPKPNFPDELHLYMQCGYLRDNVTIWSEQDFNRIHTTPPFPHFIAYYNLVASCNGSLSDNNGATLERHQCCNNRRESDFVIPLFFISDISVRISYSREGEVQYDEEIDDNKDVTSISHAIKVLKLNHDSLKLVRKAWHLIGGIIEVEEAVACVSDLDKRLEILDEADIDPLIKNTLFSDIYWKLFSEYSWFQSYYHPN